MTSFIHSAKHFNSVEKGLKNLKTKTNSDFLYRVTLPEIEKIMDGIRKLSVNSVMYQYKHHYEEVCLDDEDFRRLIKKGIDNLTSEKNFTNLSPLALFKACSSVLYQIEMDTLAFRRPIKTEEKKVYDSFVDIKSQLAEYIVRELPEYDSAKSWSI